MLVFLPAVTVYANMHLMRYTRCLAGLFWSLCCVLSNAAEQAVGCQGRIMPASRIHRLAPPTDQGTPIIGKLFVSEGDTVEEGQLVASLLAEGPARQLLAQADARHQLAKAELDAAGAAASLAKHEAARAIVEARLALAEAEAALTVARTQSARKRLPDANVQEAVAALAAQGAALTRLQAIRATLEARLNASINIAQAQVDDAGWFGGGKRIATAVLEEVRAARTLALAEHDARIAAVSDEQEIFKAKLAVARVLNAQPEREPAVVEAAGKQVVLARQRLTILEANAAVVERHHVAVIAAAEATLSEAAATVQLARVRLDMTGIRSPLNGCVLRLPSRPGEAAGIVAELADLSNMMIEAEVSIADIFRVSVGDSATILVPGMKTEKPLSGRIARLGLKAFAGTLVDDEPAAFKDLRVFPVTIELSPEVSATLRNYTGIQVSVRIECKPQ